MADHRTQPRRRGYLMRLLIVFTIVIAAVVGTVYLWSNQEDQLVSELSPATTQNPSADLVEAIPTNRPVKIEAVLPALSDEQRWYHWMVEQVLDDPQKWVGKSELNFSVNDRQLFLVLILTESSFYQFDDQGRTLDSGIGCVGLAQLCNDPKVCDPLLRWNPLENIYCGASYFLKLVNQTNGDYAMALALYKGAKKDLPGGGKAPDPSHPVVEAVMEHILLR